MDQYNMNPYDPVFTSVNLVCRSAVVHVSPDSILTSGSSYLKETLWTVRKSIRPSISIEYNDLVALKNILHYHAKTEWTEQELLSALQAAIWFDFGCSETLLRLLFPLLPGKVLSHVLLFPALREDRAKQRCVNLAKSLMKYNFYKIPIDSIEGAGLEDIVDADDLCIESEIQLSRVLQVHRPDLLHAVREDQQLLSRHGFVVLPGFSEYVYNGVHVQTHSHDRIIEVECLLKSQYGNAPLDVCCIVESSSYTLHPQGPCSQFSLISDVPTPRIWLIKSHVE